MPRHAEIALVTGSNPGARKSLFHLALEFAFEIGVSCKMFQLFLLYEE